MRRITSGFTLIELLVTISIIALLISLLLPALTQARETVKRVRCMSNQRQIGIAQASYAQDDEGRLPITMERSESSGHTWVYYVRPYLGASPAWHPALSPDYPVFHCPNSGFPESSHHAGLIYGQNVFVGGTGAGSPLGVRPRVPLASVSQPSRTISIAETNYANRGLSLVLWNPYDGVFQNNPGLVWYGMTVSVNWHDGVCNVLWLDGHGSSEENSDDLRSSSVYLMP